MQKFDNYITRRKIILQICSIRARYAQKRSKEHLIHILTTNKRHNYHLNSKNKNKKELSEDEKILHSILPSRRKWKTLNKKNRYKENGQRINSIDYNRDSLMITIKYFEKNYPNEPFLLRLNDFVKDIQFSINDPSYKIAEPTIIPKAKGNINADRNKCRPISLFTLKDKLIISLTNRYLTDVFDPFFYKESYAFRATQIIDKSKKILSHHDAISSMLRYKQSYKGKRLWVSECDIRNFYDTVHHTVVKRKFRSLINKVKKEFPEMHDERAERLFYRYLDSYSFVKNVLPYNVEPQKKKEYWEDKYSYIPGGYFGWVKDEFIKLGYFKNERGISHAKIGVPQGGALSGLIANILLDYADKKIVEIQDKRLLYLRFCDDMVIIHPSKKVCDNASRIYYSAMKDLHLVPHNFEKIQNKSIESMSKFWSPDIKSKESYKWSNLCKESFQWFGFVGYEIHYSGSLRVRKSSLVKEKKKQKETINKIIKAVDEGKRKNDNTIYESAVNRLIGMSVGRIKISNFDKVDNEMCWVNGFKLLEGNKHLKAQLKDLDRYRAKQLSTLLKTIDGTELSKRIRSKRKIKEKEFIKIKGISVEESIKIRDQLVTSGILNSNFQINDEIDLQTVEIGLVAKFLIHENDIRTILKSSIDKRDYVYYGKPFSYYYQIIERR
ncbi:reverse transcriptase domain-containing protein [Cyclobacterium xiamenense]|uniref:reverse transcriptase domain-containing protein n=1 Tax=Cyclobacterium xiamenense TaxID=1297121 RepID=UPI0012B8A7A2|nr:reverse transcriptase domain-containing protein [Cyclobacterium xiamenense]